MFALNRTTRVFLKVGASDLRLGFDGLHAQVLSILKQDVLAGHVFGFCNRARTRVKRKRPTVCRMVAARRAR